MKREIEEKAKKKKDSKNMRLKDKTERKKNQKEVREQKKMTKNE